MGPLPCWVALLCTDPCTLGSSQPLLIPKRLKAPPPSIRAPLCLFLVTFPRSHTTFRATGQCWVMQSEGQQHGSVGRVCVLTPGKGTEAQGRWEGDMTLLLPLPGLTLEVTSPVATGDFIHNGVSKRHSMPLTCPPSRPAWGWDFMGCRAPWDYA